MVTPNGDYVTVPDIKIPIKMGTFPPLDECPPSSLTPPVATAPVVPPPPPVATIPHTLPWLMGECAKHQKTKADIDAALAACGLKTIPDLLAQLDKMDAVAAALGVL